MKIRFYLKQALKLATAITLILGGETVSATPIGIVNYSFEDPIHTDGNFSVVATGWVVTGYSGTWNPTIAELNQGPTDGLQVGYSNQNGLALSQTLPDVLTANMEYSLMVDVLSRTDSSTHQFSSLELRTADDIILASASVGAIAGGSNALLITPLYLANASDPNLGKNLKIVLTAGGLQSDWDNVRLDATPSGGGVGNVPEPATFALLGIGLAGFGFTCTRKHS